MLKRLFCVVVFAGLCTGAQAQQFSIRAQRGGAVYFIGSEVPGGEDSCSEKLHDSIAPSVICAVPLYRGRVGFFFTDGDQYVYNAQEPTPAGSFLVLLRGMAKLPAYKRPTWSILDLRDRVYGDTVLLRKLRNKELIRIEYSREESAFEAGKAASQYKGAIKMKITAKEAAAIRRQLKALESK